MNTISSYKLSVRDKDILSTLFRYRGMTALQLTQKVHKSLEPRNSQKSMIHNYLKRLKEQKIITSKKLEDYVGLGSVYYLTPNGFKLTKDLLNIEIGQKGDGYTFADEIDGYHTHADLEYSIYKPPLEQIAHHLLLIESLIKIDFLNTDELIDYRLSMYATREYIYKNGVGKLRPDAELLIGDRNFFIEIDKGTEGYQQLYEKFINYRHYLSQLETSKLPSSIFFITDKKRQLYGLKRRWTTILVAYLNAMGEMATKVNLILSPINKLEGTINFEINRPKYKKLALDKVRDFLSNQGYSSINFYEIKSIVPFAVAIKNQKYQLVFLSLSGEYDSTVFGNFILFMKNMSNIDPALRKNGLTRSGLEQIILSKHENPYLPSIFPKERWSNEQQLYSEILHKYLTILQI